MRFSSIVALVLVTLVTGSAFAGDTDDTVFLTNGGRFRGTVISEEPKVVTLKLPDGTVRSFARAEVQGVQYGQPPPAAAPTATGAPTGAPAPTILIYTGRPPAPPKKDLPPRRSTGLMVVGIILTSVGVVAFPGAAVSKVVNPYSSLDTGLLIGGAIGVPLGVLAIVVGGTRDDPPAQSSQPPASTPGATSFAIGPQGVNIGWSF